ncbi:unnamed protein product [Phytophthora fragariaefolia]|uniref:Unnamed protein product n=1 Tax=Phytophthora fragariaefolia TaxID=1490495 RepID=A0A9W6XF20_9STRA|nr:unnamed protein product [Phytophthora fragariaefolia]
MLNVVRTGPVTFITLYYPSNAWMGGSALVYKCYEDVEKLGGPVVWALRKIFSAQLSDQSIHCQNAYDVQYEGGSFGT